MPAAEAESRGGPHTVVIMADQLRADMAGAATPHIDGLRSDGVVFERTYSAAPLCVPARGSFFTGRYPARNGCLINPWHPEDREHAYVRSGIPSMYSLLGDVCESWSLGTQHFMTCDEAGLKRTRWRATKEEHRSFLAEAGVRLPGGPAFRGTVPEETRGSITRVGEYSLPTTGRYEPGQAYTFDEFVTRHAVEVIESHHGGRPLLLNLMYHAPHPPLDVPDPWYSQLSEVGLPDNVGCWSPGQSPLQLYKLPGFLGSRYSREEWREVWRVYAGLVSFLDDCVGRVIDALKRAGLYDETLVVFTADHGEMLGSHQLWQKMCMYDESVRVPLVVKPPGRLTGGQVRDDVVSHVDVFPTLCDYHGAETPSGVSGLSLRGAIEFGERVDREAVFCQYNGNGSLGGYQRCVIVGPVKLIVDFFKDEVFIELYHVDADPLEQHNLAWSRREKVDELLTLLRREMTDSADALRLPADVYETFLATHDDPYEEGR